MTIKENNKILGTITKSFGRMFIVEINNVSYDAVTKAKKTNYVVGDIVELDILNSNQVQIIGLQPRHNLIFRSDQNRSKIIASNVSQMLIVIAVKPSFNINFLNSCLICAEDENIHPIIVINKSELPESPEFIAKIYALYHTQLNYSVITMSAITSCNDLKPLLANQQSLLIGQSGVGKSTITNYIIPSANARTHTITKAETSGSHTTTNATLYHIDTESSIVDCPGLHEFGLYHLKVPNLINLFPEFRSYIGQCKFRDCIHLNEPGCAIRNAIQLPNNVIDPQRIAFLHQLTQKLLNHKEKY
jgi:ribosome biogenesis GTPase